MTNRPTTNLLPIETPPVEAFDAAIEAGHAKLVKIHDRDGVAYWTLAVPADHFAPKPAVALQDLGPEWAAVVREFEAAGLVDETTDVVKTLRALSTRIENFRKFDRMHPDEVPAIETASVRTYLLSRGDTLARRALYEIEKFEVSFNQMAAERKTLGANTWSRT